ncbi:MAG: glycosyltransferase [Bacteroidales bacterium]|nr:glycosyltransferase [Bacteroidales bacterium]
MSGISWSNAWYQYSRGLKDIENEVIVVDNNSTDGSAAMINNKFPGVILIKNSSNAGFGAANNQALKIAGGENILFLNPDTVLQETTISGCLAFMDKHPEAGAAGVKMIDGKGRFLPESKRGLPTPKTAFYRISGLYKIFPRSEKFNSYYMGHLPEIDVQEIEVLTGAFFLTRREVLEETGHFDESFFMYGEDIDLSYRILNKGYKIYYLPEPSIIHYKGESTARGTLNYILHFYKAMIIFNRKHFAGNRIKLFSWMINMAIFSRGAISYLKSLARTLVLPAADFLVFYLSYIFVSGLWEKYYFNGEAQYPDILKKTILPLYVLVWVISIALFKGYKKPLQIPKGITGILAGTVFILVVYALLPLELRFSRALIILGLVMSLIDFFLIRLIAGFAGIIKVQGVSNRERKAVIVSNPGEYEKIRQIINTADIPYRLCGRVNLSGSESKHDSLGKLENIKEIIRVNNIDEVIFSSSDLSAGEIIELMKMLAGSSVSKKIARTDSDYVIGSKSKLLPGEINSLRMGKII